MAFKINCSSVVVFITMIIYIYCEKKMRHVFLYFIEIIIFFFNMQVNTYILKYITSCSVGIILSTYRFLEYE